jgi:uncharacterized protein (TIGR04255 family)
MPIPPRPRVVFSRNPLVEVSVKMQFPKLLEIETELPVRFQAEVRDRLPTFDINRIVNVPLGPTSPNVGAPGETRQYEMGSPDARWRVTLASEFISLTTNKYEAWLDFREQVGFVFRPFFQNYRVGPIKSISIRYKDSISRKALGIEDVPWRELLAPHIAGVLSINDVSSEFLGLRNYAALKLRSDLVVHLLYGLVKGVESDDPDFVIDSDFISYSGIEGTTDAALSALEAIRPLPNNLFLWCISERLYTAMGGVEQPES